MYRIHDDFWLFVNHCNYEYFLEAPHGFTPATLKQALGTLMRFNLAMVELWGEDLADVDTAILQGRRVLLPLEHIDPDLFDHDEGEGCDNL